MAAIIPRLLAATIASPVERFQLKTANVRHLTYYSMSVLKSLREPLQTTEIRFFLFAHYYIAK